jgi:hypothetical protein
MGTGEAAGASRRGIGPDDLAREPIERPQALRPRRAERACPPQPQQRYARETHDDPEVVVTDRAGRRVPAGTRHRLLDDKNEEACAGKQCLSRGDRIGARAARTDLLPIHFVVVGNLRTGRNGRTGELE